MDVDNIPKNLQLTCSPPLFHLNYNNKQSIDPTENSVYLHMGRQVDIEEWLLTGTLIRV